MILIIDNYDSFTYNLYQQIETLGKKTKVVKNDEINIDEILKLNPAKIVISPGPGRPDDSGISMKVIEKFHQNIPMLGVCLGHECIGQFFGSNVIPAKNILHGKTSNIYHNNKGLFSGLKKPFKAARYHSLILNETPLNFTFNAWTEKNEIMGIEHNQYPLFGVQFHPESFLTPEGSKLMHNFLYEI